MVQIETILNRVGNMHKTEGAEGNAKLVFTGVGSKITFADEAFTYNAH